MAAVRQKDTGPEITLRRALHKSGLRYRLHEKTLPGTPDICFPKWRAVILVHGCFWHRHEGCKKASLPKSNLLFWESKFRRNVERDRKNVEDLLAANWRVAIVWECWLSHDFDDTKSNELVSFIRDSDRVREEWPNVVQCRASAYRHKPTT